MNPEQVRLSEDARRERDWKRGPYLSERQWGTVREDYSASGDAGTTSRTIMRAAAPIAGAKTACWASATPGPHVLRARTVERQG